MFSEVTCNRVRGCLPATYYVYCLLVQFLLIGIKKKMWPISCFHGLGDWKPLKLLVFTVLCPLRASLVREAPGLTTDRLELFALGCDNA